MTVTDTALKVKDASYRISGITKLSFWTIRPDRWPGVALLLIGLVAAVFGFMDRVPAAMSVETNNGAIEASTIAIWAGIAMVIIGALILLLSHEKYAVRIGTAEGEKNAVVSRKREYIAQIVDAVRSAFDLDKSRAPFTTPHEPGL